MKGYMVWAKKDKKTVFKSVTTEVDLYNLVNDALAYEDFDELTIRTNKYNDMMEKSERIGW